MVDPNLVRALSNAGARASCGCPHVHKSAVGPTGQSTAELAVTGQLGVDAAAMWQMASGNLYGSSDRLICAARELLQNARDAVERAYKGRDGYKLEPGTGVIAFELTRQSDGMYTLSCQDNGTGMSCTFENGQARGVLPEKFFVLGGTGFLINTQSLARIIRFSLTG